MARSEAGLPRIRRDCVLRAEPAFPAAHAGRLGRTGGGPVPSAAPRGPPALAAGIRPSVMGPAGRRRAFGSGIAGRSVRAPAVEPSEQTRRLTHRDPRGRTAASTGLIAEGGPPIDRRD